MIVEERIYTLHPGKVAVFLDIYQNTVYPLQAEILGTMIGYFVTDVGPLNQIVHLWGYEDLEERRKRRQALVEMTEWQEFLRKILPLIVTMENKILIPTVFSPIQ